MYLEYSERQCDYTYICTNGYRVALELQLTATPLPLLEYSRVPTVEALGHLQFARNRSLMLHTVARVL